MMDDVRRFFEGMKTEEGLLIKKVDEIQVDAEVVGCQLKDSRGKHIELKLVIPYTEESMRALGEMFGRDALVHLQCPEYEAQIDADGNAPDLFDSEEDEA